MQCVVQKGGSSWKSYSGAIYRAWYSVDNSHYETICAGRGDSNIQKDFLKVCEGYVSLCDQGYSEVQVVSKMKCVVQGLEQYKERICNGASYTLIATSGNWSYRGYTGSITAVDAGQDGACFAICNLEDTYYSEHLKTVTNKNG